MKKYYVVLVCVLSAISTSVYAEKASSKPDHNVGWFAIAVASLEDGSCVKKRLTISINDLVVGELPWMSELSFVLDEEDTCSGTFTQRTTTGSSKSGATAEFEPYVDMAIARSRMSAYVLAGIRGRTRTFTFPDSPEYDDVIIHISLSVSSDAKGGQNVYAHASPDYDSKCLGVRYTGNMRARSISDMAVNVSIDGEPLEFLWDAETQGMTGSFTEVLHQWKSDFDCPDIADETG